MYLFLRMTSLSFALSFYTFVTEQLLLLTKTKISIKISILLVESIKHMHPVELRQLFNNSNFLPTSKSPRRAHGHN